MDKIKQLFLNNVMYYIIVPIFITLSSWIKGWVEELQRSGGGLKIKSEVICPFEGIVIVSWIIQLILCFFAEVFLETFNCGIVIRTFAYVLCMLMTVPCLSKLERAAQVRIEIEKNRVLKEMYLLTMGLISYGPVLIQELLYNIKMTIVWCVIQTIFIVFIIFFSDSVVKYENSYVNIFASNGYIIRKIRVNEIQKKGKWIFITNEKSSDNKQIRIRADLLEKIEYFGQPYIYIQNIEIKWVKKLRVNIKKCEFYYIDKMWPEIKKWFIELIPGLSESEHLKEPSIIGIYDAMHEFAVKKFKGRKNN